VTLFAGSSGWSYPSWRPSFYPAAARPEDFLKLYAAQLPAVELNSTGYRLPSEEQFRRWAESVPAGFRFAVKMPPQALRRLDAFQERVLALDRTLGCVRVVVESPRDDGLLALVLGSADPSIRYAFDLRDPSWDGVESRLAESGAVRVDDWAAPTDWRYLRFRDPPYGDADLTAFAAQVKPLLAAGIDTFAFFRHEDEPTAPRYALRLRKLLTS
jgi:uncharacterized protein YecE (DUF72 family)